MYDLNNSWGLDPCLSINLHWNPFITKYGDLYWPTLEKNKHIILQSNKYWWDWQATCNLLITRSCGFFPELSHEISSPILHSSLKTICYPLKAKPCQCFINVQGGGHQESHYLPKFHTAANHPVCSQVSNKPELSCGAVVWWLWTLPSACCQIQQQLLRFYHQTMVLQISVRKIKYSIFYGKSSA